MSEPNVIHALLNLNLIVAGWSIRVWDRTPFDMLSITSAFTSMITMISGEKIHHQDMINSGHFPVMRWQIWLLYLYTIMAQQNIIDVIVAKPMNRA